MIHETMFTFDMFEAVCCYSSSTLLSPMTSPCSLEIRSPGHHTNPARLRRTVQGIQFCGQDEANSQPHAPAGRQGEGGGAVLQRKGSGYC